MYCSKCHKRNPNNFKNCAYCGAELSPPKKEKPQKFVKKRKFKLNIPLKALVASIFAVATVLAVVAIFTANFSGAKSDRVVKTFVKAISTENSDLYYTLYDEDLKKYKRDNRYFGDEETYKQIVLPVKQSNDFYKEKCGEGYKLSYFVKSIKSLEPSDVDKFCNVLESNFNYINKPTKVDVISVEITAEGDKGKYKTIYDDFWCMKIKGRWYKVDKNISAEYNNEKTAK